MPDFAGAYAEERRRVAELVRSLDDAQLAAIVPACPAWTVKDLIAHLCHVAESYSKGDVPTASAYTQGAGANLSDEELARVRDAWTQSGVDARKHRSLGEVLAEWEEHAKVLGPMLAGEVPWPEGFPGLIAQYGAVGDISAHHNDIRGALGLEAERDGVAREISYEAQLFLLKARGTSLDTPAIRFLTQRGEHVIGNGEPVATIEVDWFELLRAVGGRRSADQIRAMFGDVDAEPYLSIMSGNPLPTEPLH